MKKNGSNFIKSLDKQRNIKCDKNIFNDGYIIFIAPNEYWNHWLNPPEILTEYKKLQESLLKITKTELLFVTFKPPKISRSIPDKNEEIICKIIDKELEFKIKL